MKAFQQIAYGTKASDVLQFADNAPIPSALKKGEVLIRTHASSLAIGDIMVGKGAMEGVGMKIPFPSTIGRDCAGVVEAIAPDTETSLKVGDRVAAYVEVGGGRGSFAERVVAEARYTAVMPASLSFLSAACLPTSACTSYQALVDSKVLKKGAGQKILVLGGSTATGSFGIQLARLYGCSEITVTSSQVELCTRLGATRVINHRKGEKWEEILAGASYDIIYDCIEGLSAWRKHQNAARPVLKSWGTWVNLTLDEPHAAPTVGGMLLFVGRVLYRKAWSWFGYPTFHWVINMSPCGLQELVNMAAAGDIECVLETSNTDKDTGKAVPFPPTWEGIQRMWEILDSGRAHDVPYSVMVQHCRARMSFMSRAELEIERKFFVNNETIQLLQQRCARPKCIDMLDEYWDTGPSLIPQSNEGRLAVGLQPYTLSTADAWLRRRNDTWELKWPAVSLQAQLQALQARRADGQVGHAVPADQYNEYTNLAEIRRQLAALGVQLTAASEVPFHLALSSAGLSAFARIRTARTRYELDPRDIPLREGNVLMQGVTLGVDVDEVEYEDLPAGMRKEPYRLAEVEVVIPFSSLSGQGDQGDSAARTQAVQLADRLIEGACARFRIQTDYTSTQDPTSQPRRIHGKVIEYLVRYDVGRLEACRKAGLLAIKTGEEMR